MQIQFSYFMDRHWHQSILSILSIVMLSSNILNAKSYAPFSTDYDTLITKQGVMKLVVVLKSSVGTLYYQDCGKQRGQVKQMPRGDVQDIRIHWKTKRLHSLLKGRKQKKSSNAPSQSKLRLAPVGLALTMMGLFMFSLLFFSWTGFFELLFFAAICLIITGIVFSMIILKLTRNSKEMYKEERRMAMAGLLVGLLPIVFTLLIYLFYLVYNL